MAARKKKAKSKKKVSSKSTASRSKAKKKTSAKKLATKKKKVAAKKSVAKKKAVSKAKTAKSAVKTVKGDDEATAKSVARKQKLSSVKSKKIGSRVKTLTGRSIGERGVIVRQDACLGTFFILLDRHQNNPVYKSIEWGPYFESQLEFLKSR